MTTNLEPISQQSEIKISYQNDTITVMEMVYINQHFAVNQIPKFNSAYTSIIESLCLVLAPNKVMSNIKKILAHQQFNISIQKLVYHTHLVIFQIVTKLS